ncbi:MAG: hypothetical protein ACE37F_03850 [Nannocystaceae bacterium]|nr:hypothetical protein [bacterium]
MTAWLVALLSVAPAQPTWSAPAGCPSQREVEQEVEALLLEPSKRPLEYAGKIDVVPAGYRLQLDVGATSRVIEAVDCRRLGTAAALIIAVEHDPIAVAVAVEPVVQEPEPERPWPEPPPEPKPPPAAVAPRPDPAPEPPPTRRPFHGTVRAGVGVELGNVPRPGALFLLAGGVGGPRWRVELGGTASLPRDVPVEDRRSFGARATLLAGHARGCWLPGGERVQVPLCGGLEAGGLWARGYGPGVSPSARTQLWMAALASAGLNYWVSSRFGIMADAELDVALRQPAVTLIGVSDVFRAGAVGARLVVGPVLRFP